MNPAHFMKQRWRSGGVVLALVVAVLLPTVARAEWTVNSLERQPGGDGAIEYRRYSLGQPDSGKEIELHLALFSPKKAALRVI
ncbi:MAG: hypothetical protein ABIR29_03045, partial [Chthoniobacterales bacterium]